MRIIKTLLVILSTIAIFVSVFLSFCRFILSDCYVFEQLVEWKNSGKIEKVARREADENFAKFKGIVREGKKLLTVEQVNKDLDKLKGETLYLSGKAYFIVWGAPEGCGVGGCAARVELHSFEKDSREDLLLKKEGKEIQCRYPRADGLEICAGFEKNKAYFIKGTLNKEEAPMDRWFIEVGEFKKL